MENKNKDQNLIKYSTEQTSINDNLKLALKLVQISCIQCLIFDVDHSMFVILRERCHLGIVDCLCLFGLLHHRLSDQFHFKVAHSFVVLHFFGLNSDDFCSS